MNNFIIKKCLNSITYNDCLFFDSDEMTKEAYFKTEISNINHLEKFNEDIKNANPILKTNIKVFNGNRKNETIVMKTIITKVPLNVGFPKSDKDTKNLVDDEIIDDSKKNNIDKNEINKRDELNDFNSITYDRNDKFKYHIDKSNDHSFFSASKVNSSDIYLKQSSKIDIKVKEDNINSPENHISFSNIEYNSKTENIYTKLSKKIKDKTENSPHLNKKNDYLKNISIQKKISSKKDNSHNIKISDNKNETENIVNKKKRNNNILNARNKNHTLTIRDYEELNPKEAKIYDKRSFICLFKTHLLNDHILLNLIFKRSILEPLWLRVVYFIFEVTIVLFVNGIFFTDDLIDERSNHTQEERVKLFKLFVFIIRTL